MKRGLLLDLPGGVGRRLELLYCFVTLRPLALATILLRSVTGPNLNSHVFDLALFTLRLLASD